MWYILEAQPGAQLVLGFDRPLTRQLVREAAERGGLGRYLRYVPVKRGDAFLIEPGTVHAIGGGIVLAEIQQSSDVTYRLWDYGRKDKDGKLRPLHIDSAPRAVFRGRGIQRVQSPRRRRVSCRCSPRRRALRGGDLLRL